MRFYEIIFIVRQDVTAAQVETLAETYSNVIKESGGEVSKTEFCGLRNLAYRIKKNRKGHYVLLNVTASPAAIVEVERRMKLNEDILRHLSVAVEELDPSPSPLMQQRSYRDDQRGTDEEEGMGDLDMRGFKEYTPRESSHQRDPLARYKADKSLEVEEA